MMKKTIHLLALGVLMSSGMYAQSLEDGVKAYYNGNYASAINILEKQTGNAEAAYWLATSYFQQEKNALANEVISKAIATNAGNPYLLVAKGHSLLLDKKVAEATQSFDAAIAAAGKKDEDKARVLNAVGAATTKVFNNIDKVGDIKYAVAKLEEAKNLVMGIKEKNRPAKLLADINTNLADATLKANPGEGSRAFTLYQDALSADPTFAKAEYRKAMIFKSQRNVDLFLETLQKTLSANPHYLPALYDLYNYNAFTVKSIEAAKPYGETIVSQLPPSPNNEYFKAVALYVNKSYPQAIGILKNIIAQAGDKTNPQSYKLAAYSLIENKDTAAAIPYVEDYFKNQAKEDIVPLDYVLKATAYSTTPGKEGEVVQTFLDASAADTTLAGKIEVLETGAKTFATSGKGALAADLYSKIIEIKPSDKLTVNDFFNAGYTGYYKSGQYEKAWKIFDAARTRFPDWNYGYRFAYSSSRVFDSTYSLNKWIPDAEKFIEFLQSSKDSTMTDAEKRPLIFSAAVDLLTYHFNVKKDKPTALNYAILAYNNADSQGAKDQLGGYIKALGGTIPSSSGGTTNPIKENSPSK